MLLNQAILSLAPPHEARAIAPATFRELMACGASVVWDGASDNTIYHDARVNHAFRAWHDACHIAGGYDFTLEGERATCERQIRELVTRYPSAPQWALDVIRAEVVGQAEHFARFGFFPTNQEEFIQWTLTGQYPYGTVSLMAK